MNCNLASVANARADHLGAMLACPRDQARRGLRGIAAASKRGDHLVAKLDHTVCVGFCVKTDEAHGDLLLALHDRA